MMINDVVPAIQARFPTCEQTRYSTIYIQQDGAPSHIPTKHENDPWFEEMEELGISERIKLVTQPANSPDANINDLGFFNALQATTATRKTGKDPDAMGMPIWNGRLGSICP